MPRIRLEKFPVYYLVKLPAEDGCVHIRSEHGTFPGQTHERERVFILRSYAPALVALCAVSSVELDDLLALSDGSGPLVQYTIASRSSALCRGYADGRGARVRSRMLRPEWRRQQA